MRLGLIWGIVLAGGTLWANPSCNIKVASPLFKGAYNSPLGFGGIPVGASVKLDASGSKGKGSLTHSWSLALSPNGDAVSWDDAASAKPTLSSLDSPWTYLVLDTITDRDGATQCPFQVGVVAADERGIIDLTRMTNIEDGPKLEKLIGPLIRVGASDWPWADDRNQYALDQQLRMRSSYYAGYWKTKQPGTIILKGNQIVGSGTNFIDPDTGVCTAPGRARPGAYLAIRYATNPERWTLAIVASCEDDTHLTLANTYPKSEALKWAKDLPNCDIGCPGLAYAWTWDGDGPEQGYGVTWRYIPAPANYYDNVVALYTYAYRSGLQTYLTEAGKLADDWWQDPAIDHGQGCETFDNTWNNNAACYGGSFRRILSLTGIMVRALEKESVLEDLRRYIWPRCIYYAVTLNASNRVIDDVREQSYMQSCVADGALIETDAAQRTKLTKALSDGLSTWGSYQAPDGSFVQFNTGTGGSGINSTRGATASLTKGSTAVTFSVPCPAPTASAATWKVWYGWFWDTNPSAYPRSNADGDSRYYVVSGCDGKGTTATLNAPYEGATGTKGFLVTQPTAAWGTQPFFQGLLGIAFEQSGKALEEVSPADSKAYYGYVDDIAEWEVTYGWNRTDSGMYSYYSSVCLIGGSSVPAKDLMCGTSGQDGPESRRTLNAEVVRTIAMSYARTGTVELRNAARALMNEMYCKKSTGCAYEAEADGNYIGPLDDGQYYVAGQPPLGTSPKWVGQFFGYPESASSVPALLRLRQPQQ